MGKRRRKDVVALLLFHSQCKVAAFSFLFTKKRLRAFLNYCSVYFLVTFVWLVFSNL
jgi:hypothetical protein